METEKPQTEKVKRPGKDRLAEIKQAGEKYPWIPELFAEIEALKSEMLELADIAVQQTKIAFYLMERGDVFRGRHKTGLDN